MFKILDKRNGEVTAEQQAVFNKISTNNADGYVDGFLNSLRISKLSSNMISIDSGLLSIQGFRSVNDTLTTYTVSVTPSEPILFQLVATYSHYISDENDTLEITTRPVQELRREPLFSGQDAVYEVELAEFNMTADGIADFTVTLEKIVYNEQDLSELLDKVTKAEQDSKTALDKVNALETQVIEKQGTVVSVGGVPQQKVEFALDPQKQLDALMPAVGDYYFTESATVNPAERFGGSWTKLADVFLVAAGGKYAVGSTGGEESHALTVQEMPEHYHEKLYYNSITSNRLVTASEGSGTAYSSAIKANSSSDGNNYITGKTGGSKSHNNLPPYRAVYMWRREA